MRAIVVRCCGFVEEGLYSLRAISSWSATEAILVAVPSVENGVDAVVGFGLCR
jgi:hypothetical protein